MQFLKDTFGEAGATIITAVLALVIVLILIVLSVWMLKFVFKTSANVGRGRERRLSVIDTLALDQKRQLLIVRRDNVEHLILTGGPQDLLIESGIAGAVAAAPPVEAPTPAPVERKGLFRRPTPAGKPVPPSLRHTGLMRETPSPGVIPANLDQPERDSVRTSPLADPKGGNSERDGTKASDDT